MADNEEYEESLFVSGVDRPSIDRSDCVLCLVMARRLVGRGWKRLTEQPALCAMMVVPSADWIAPIGTALASVAKWNNIFDNTRTNRAMEDGLRHSAQYLSSGKRVLFIAVRSSKGSPELMRASADILVEFPSPTAKDIRRTIELVTQRPCPALPSSLGSGLGFQTIAAAIRPGTTPSSCIKRLHQARERLRDEPSAASTPPLAELHGYGEAMDWALRLMSDLESWRKGKLAFEALDRMVVLAGPPGVGKTTFVRSLAKSSGLPLHASSVADWFSSSNGYLDGVIKAMDGLFARAQADAPAVVLLDEIDAIPDRSALDSRHREWWTTMVGRMLTILDGASDHRNRLVFIGTTNYPDRLDSALVRPGRLSRIIRIEPPEAKALFGILRQRVGHDLTDQELHLIALLAVGGTGADVAGWVGSARAVARSQGRPMVAADLIHQIAPVPDLPFSVIRRVAVHEAGHAVLASTLAIGRVESVRITGVGSSGGNTLVADAFKPLMTLSDIRDLAVFILAGRAAEMVVLGDASSGAGGSQDSDLAKATRLIAANHLSYGFGDGLGYLADEGGLMTALARDPSLRSIVDRDLGTIFQRALAIAQRHALQIAAVADALIERRLLTGDELRRMLDVGRDAVEPKEPGNG